MTTNQKVSAVRFTLGAVLGATLTPVVAMAVIIKAIEVALPF